MKKTWIISDLDGVFMGRARERTSARDKTNDYARLLGILSEKNYEMIFLTDRGVAQLAPLAYLFAASRFHAGESGAAIYDAHAHSIIIHPDFAEHADEIIKIRKELRKEHGERYPIEPGVRTSVRVERVNGTDLFGIQNHLNGIAQKNSLFISADHGDCLSLKPKIDKGIGIAWLEQMYEKAGNPIDFASALWIGDGKSDIPAAKYIKERGGKISGVANSQEEYKEFIKKNNGYLAANEYTAGMVEILCET